MVIWIYSECSGLSIGILWISMVHYIIFGSVLVNFKCNVAKYILKYSVAMKPD